MASEKSTQTESKLILRQQKAQEARRALSEYEATAKAVDARTARLRALRLAKEAADAAKAPEAKPARRRKASAP